MFTPKGMWSLIRAYTEICLIHCQALVESAEDFCTYSFMLKSYSELEVYLDWRGFRSCQFISLMSCSGGLLFGCVQSLILIMHNMLKHINWLFIFGRFLVYVLARNCLWWLGFPVIFFSPSSQFMDTNLIQTKTAVEWLPVLLCSLDVLVLNLVWETLIWLKSLWCSSTWPAMPQHYPRLC